MSLPQYFWPDIARAITISLWGILIMSGAGAMWYSVKAERARVKAGGSRDDRFSEAQSIGLGVVLLALIFAYATEIAFRIAFTAVHTPTSTFTYFNIFLFATTDALFYWAIKHDTSMTRRLRVRPIYDVTVYYEGDNVIAETNTIPEAKVIVNKLVIVHDPLSLSRLVKGRLATLLDTEPYLLDVRYVNQDGTPYIEHEGKHRKR